MSEIGECHYCGTSEEELRPYGPGGSYICFPCIEDSPERNEAAVANFVTLVEAAHAVSDIIMLGPDGPQPLVTEKD